MDKQQRVGRYVAGARREDERRQYSRGTRLLDRRGARHLNQGGAASHGVGQGIRDRQWHIFQLQLRSAGGSKRMRSVVGGVPRSARCGPASAASTQTARRAHSLVASLDPCPSNFHPQTSIPDFDFSISSDASTHQGQPPYSFVSTMATRRDVRHDRCQSSAQPEHHLALALLKSTQFSVLFVWNFYRSFQALTSHAIKKTSVRLYSASPQDA